MGINEFCISMHVSFPAVLVLGAISGSLAILLLYIGGNLQQVRPLIIMVY